MGSLIRVTFVLALTSTGSTAHAELKVTSPARACQVLKTVGFEKMSSWKAFSGQTYGCNSPYWQVGSGFPLPNNLAYYVDGTATKVTKASIVLNVNNAQQVSVANNLLLRASLEMATALTGQGLPNEVENAILADKPIMARIGTANVEVTRENWPTGQGYEIHVIVR